MDENQKLFLQIGLQIWITKEDDNNNVLNFSKLCEFITKCHPEMQSEEICEAANFFLEHKKEEEKYLTIDEILLNFKIGYEEDRHAVESELANLVTFQ